MVNIGKSQLGGVSGDALMKGIDNIVFGQHLSKVHTWAKVIGYTSGYDFRLNFLLY